MLWSYGGLSVAICSRSLTVSVFARRERRNATRYVAVRALSYAECRALATLWEECGPKYRRYKNMSAAVGCHCTLVDGAIAPLLRGASRHQIAIGSAVSKHPKLRRIWLKPFWPPPWLNWSWNLCFAVWTGHVWLHSVKWNDPAWSSKWNRIKSTKGTVPWEEIGSWTLGLGLKSKRSSMEQMALEFYRHISTLRKVQTLSNTSCYKQVDGGQRSHVTGCFKLSIAPSFAEASRKTHIHIACTYS